MKKSIISLAFVMPLVFMGCGEDVDKKAEKGGDSFAGSAGKSLVKKLTVRGNLVQESQYPDGDYEKKSDKIDATLNIVYDKGRMKQILADGDYRYTYDSKDGYGEEHGEIDGKGDGKMEFVYKGDTVVLKGDVNASFTQKVVEKDEDGIMTDKHEERRSALGSGEYSYKLQDKVVVSGNGSFRMASDPETGRERFTCTYDDLGQLASVRDSDDPEYKIGYEWKDGNIVGMVWEWNENKSFMRKLFRNLVSEKNPKAAKAVSDWIIDDDMKVEYSGKENKCNVDFIYLMACLYEPMAAGQFIGVFGFMGKESKNLPARILTRDEKWNDQTGVYEYGEWKEYLKFEYSFTDGGLVKKIKVKKVEKDVDGYGTEIETYEGSMEFAY